MDIFRYNVHSAVWVVWVVWVGRSRSRGSGEGKVDDFDGGPIQAVSEGDRNNELSSNDYATRDMTHNNSLLLLLIAFFPSQHIATFGKFRHYGGNLVFC